MPQLPQIPIRHDQPIARGFHECSDESPGGTRDDLGDAPRVHRLAVLLSAAGDLGAHDIARHCPAVIAWRNK